MCLVLSAGFPADPSSAAQARSLLAETARSWRLDQLVVDGQVGLSELATNAFCHAGSPITVTFGVADGFFEVDVVDGSPQLPRMRAVRDDLDADIAELLDRGVKPGDMADRDPRMHVGPAGAVLGGRGLLLIEALTDEWGARRLDDGKVVWFRLPVPDGWHPDEPCTCSTAAPTVELGSGSRVRQPS